MLKRSQRGERFSLMSANYHLEPPQLLTFNWTILMLTPLSRTSIFAPPDEYYGVHPTVAKFLKKSTHGDYHRALLLPEQDIGMQRILISGLDRPTEQLTNTLFADNPAAPGQRQLICNVVSALSHRMPAIRNHLNITRKVLKGWSHTLKPRQAAPLTSELVYAFVGAISKSHSTAEALCVFTAWSGLLRASEAVALITSDVALPGDPAYPTVAQTRLQC